MVIYFFDTSALIKKYHEESGTKIVEKIFEQKDREIYASNLVIPEIICGFYKYCHTRNEISKPELKELLQGFYQDIDKGAILLYPITSEHVFKSEEIIEGMQKVRFPGGTRPSPMDILILSSAEDFLSSFPDFKFVSSDRSLNEISKKRGVTNILNPEMLTDRDYLARSENWNAESSS